MSFVVQNSPRLFNFDCVLKPEAIEGAFKKNAKHKRKPNKQKEKKDKQTSKQNNAEKLDSFSSERMYFGLKGNNDILRYSNFLTCISLKPVDKTYF